MDENGFVRGADYSVEAGAVSYEYEPCPRWMRESTYRGLLDRLHRGMRETPERELDALAVWTARHVTVVTQPPKLVSDGGAYDLIGVALGIALEAKRRGLSARDLGAPRRRRLLDR